MMDVCAYVNAAYVCVYNESKGQCRSRAFISLFYFLESGTHIDSEACWFSFDGWPVRF